MSTELQKEAAELAERLNRQRMEAFNNRPEFPPKLLCGGCLDEIGEREYHEGGLCFTCRQRESRAAWLEELP